MATRGMNKWGKLKELIKQSNVIVEVVDARDIPGTRLPQAEKMAGSNRLVIAVNKIDLLSEDQYLKLPGNSIAISAKDTSGHARSRIMQTIMARSEARPIHALFVGYPNVGKSSLINLLAKRKVARVSDVAGTTKNIQWVNITGDLMVTDYRGLFPNRESKKALVRKGALNVQGDEERYAYQFADQVLTNPKLREWLEGKYDLDLSNIKSSEELLAAIAKRRNWFIKGGELNIMEAAKALVRAMKEAPEI